MLEMGEKMGNGVETGAGQTDPDKCVYCLPLPFPLRFTAPQKTLDGTDSAGMGSACPDAWERTGEGRLGSGHRLSWQMCHRKLAMSDHLQAWPGNLVIATWGT